MSRIQQTFSALNGAKALIPYITVGDPSLETTLALMHSLVANGADILELGVPFSDPMADGPTIQRAAERALANHVSLRDVLETVRLFRQTNDKTPVVLMGYLNPVHKMGYQAFAQVAAEAGVDGVLTVDSPVETIAPLHESLKAQGIDCIFLIAPTTTEERIQTIAKVAGGFVYYVSLKGVTGAASLDTEEVSRKIELCANILIFRSVSASALIMRRVRVRLARWRMPLLSAAVSSKRLKATQVARPKR